MSGLGDLENKEGYLRLPQLLQALEYEVSEITLNTNSDRIGQRQPTEFQLREEKMISAIDMIYHGIRYAIVGRHLEIFRGHVRLARLDLAPRADEEVRIGDFRREGRRCWAPVEGDVVGKVVVEIKDGYVSYAVETSQKHYAKLAYFPGSDLDGDLWHTFVWAQRDRAWDIDEDVSVRVGDTRPDTVDLREGWIIDPGDYPPYWPGRGCPRVCAAHHKEFGWWGMCIPGPLPVCDTYFTMQQGKFEILFDYLRPGCDSGFMPTVYFVLPLAEAKDPYSVMGPVWELNAPWRLVPGRDYERSKFQGLAICHPWEAMQHAAGNAFTDPIPPAEAGSPMNSDFLLRLLKELVDIEPSLKWHFWLPQGWYRNIGDFAVGDNFGGEAGFRRLAEEFRKAGHLLTVHVRLNHFNDRSKVGREHPEWTAPLRPSRPKPYWSANEKYEGVSQIMDITREDVRKHLKWQVERFLSDETGLLNMDGLQATGDHWPSALDYELADNDYGVGDLLAYKINKELLLCGKSIKPYSWIAGTNNPLYGMAEGFGTMEDHLSVPIHTIQQLRLITNLCPTLKLHIASYCTTRTKSLTVWPLSVAVGPPEIDNPRAFTPPDLGPNWIQMDEYYKRRMAAVLFAYANSPRTRDTVNVPVKVEDEGTRLEVFAGRKRTEGPLAGFYSALSLGSRTVVTYSEHRAVVASTLSRKVTFPLPPGANVKSVVRVGHSGGVNEHQYELTSDGIRFHVPDAASETKVIEVHYEIKSG